MTIPHRDVAFDLDPTKVPRDWVQGDPFQTTFINALSLLFPEGERFFVDSVKRMQSRIADPALRRAVHGFVAQEAMHGREHRAFNELVVAHGYRAAPRIEARLRGFLGWLRKVLTARSQLAITCALEHFTAMLGETLLRDPRLRDEIDPAVQPLWLWHALEETEHKAVAFDVYRAVGGGYVRRATMMLLTTVGFLLAHAIVHARLMATRRILWKPWRWGRGLVRMWIAPGYLTRLVPAYLSYFRPRFHPDDRDARALVDTWRTKLFGAQGLDNGKQHVYLEA
jgi:uncharacterized protein